LIVVAVLTLSFPPAETWTLAGFFKALASRLGGDAEPLDEPAIQRLVERARAGDRDAAQRLYRQNVDRVFRTVRGMLRSDTEAEDVTQDAMLAVLTSLDRYSPRSDARFAAWVASVATNTARRRFRRQRPELTETGELPDLLDEQAQPEREVDTARERAALLRALAELAPAEREIVSLRYGAELNASEIAKLVKLESANVRKILERTRERLGLRIEALLKREGTGV
jgi:RNA polymerase sigma-70 factor (ECF subfamily)